MQMFKYTTGAVLGIALGVVMLWSVASFMSYPQQQVSGQIPAAEQLAAAPISEQPKPGTPASGQSDSARSALIEPVATKPAVTVPASVQPTSTQLVSEQPVSPSPVIAEPVATEPDLTVLASVQLDVAAAVSAEPVSLQPESAPETTRQQVQRLIDDLDFEAVEAVLKQTHLQALAGQISQDELREIFSVFRSSSPDIRSFADNWVGNMPNSPYALNAFAINSLAAGSDIRGTAPEIFSYPKADIQAVIQLTRSELLAERAYRIAPDLVVAADTLMAGNLVSTDRSGKILAQTELLDQVMTLSPNRGSLIRAIAVTQPKWGGTYQDAVELCINYAQFVLDPKGYTTEICMVDAAFTHDYGSDVREMAQAILRDSDHPFLDFARDKDWQPVMSDAGDQNSVDYLQGEGPTE